MKILCIGIALFILIASAECAKILVIFHMASKSHFILGSSYIKALANAGHDVTIVSPFEEKEKPKNGSIRNIILTGFKEEHENLMKVMNPFEKKPNNIFLKYFLTSFMHSMVSDLTRKTLAHPNLQKLLNSNEEFDLVVWEVFGNDAFAGIAHHFKAPFILFSTIGPSSMVNSKVANPSPASYIPEMIHNTPTPMNFLSRVDNLIFSTYSSVFTTTYGNYVQDRMLQEYLPGSPPVAELMKNASLVLLNSHISTFRPVPSVPSMVEIGGFHVQPPKKLPTDLQKILDEAKDGAIYFSMGSNLKSKNLPVHIRDAILKSFAKFPKLKVLWKWEDDNLPNKPANIETRKWFPQQDVLAHKNVKLFITHGGILSTTETIYHGVPILAIPVFGDQEMNAKRAEDNGYGLVLHLHDINEQTLTNALEKILSNEEYGKVAKKRSRLMFDRPVKPLDNAVFWTEYVIRHNGAAHLRVAGVNLPWYSYYSIDVIVFLISVLYLIIYIVKKGFKLVCKPKTKKVKTN